MRDLDSISTVPVLEARFIAIGPSTYVHEM